MTTYIDTPVSLYERLGGKVAIDEAIGIFQRSVHADETWPAYAI